jgi:TonB-linked SusC/RagA family outer membrane protein
MRRALLIAFASLFVLSSWAMAQRTISGTVTDAGDGSSLPGVNVVIKGTASGTVTDIDGKYSLQAKDDATLVFSYVGYVAQEIAVGAQATIDVSLAADVKALEEVVVTGFGVERQQKALGYAVQEVNGEGLSKARETNVVNSLSGKVAGVQVTSSSGAVGSSARIVLRGPASLTQDNQPLFVVDGIPINNTNYGSAGSSGGSDFPNGAADINPDDIASISVLKGPNAAALYGSRAANGVILITTKSGKGTKGIGVSINSTTTFENPLRTPNFQNSYGQGQSDTNFEWVDGNLGSGAVDESWGAPLDIGLNFTQWTDANNPSPWVSKPDNVRDMYDTGVTSSNNVALTGGNDKGSFRLSFTNVDQKGMVPFTGLKRKTFSVNSGYNLTEKLHVGVSVQYVKSEVDAPTGGYDSGNPIQQTIWSGRNVDFNGLRDWRNLPLAAPTTPAAGTPLNWNTKYQNNPFWSLETNEATENKDRIIGNINISYQLTDWLSLTGKVGTDHWSSIQKFNWAVGSNQEINGRYDQNTRTWTEVNSNLLLAANKKLNDDWTVSGTVGVWKMSQEYDRLYVTVPQLQLPGLYTTANLKSGSTLGTIPYHSDQKVNSGLFQGQVAFKNYLFLDVSGRKDWSSTLPAANNAFFYPSVSVSAVISDILAIDNDVLSFLKTRISWAKVGNSPQPYSTSQVFKFRSSPWGDTPLLYEFEELQNPDLTPEFNTSLEFGLDARLFNGRLGFDFTYYNAKGSDLIILAGVSSASGYTDKWLNAGETVNKGVELQLTGTPFKSGAFTWDVALNFAKNNNEVVELAPNVSNLILGGQWNVNLEARPGLPYGVLFGPAYERSDAGEIVYKNGLPQIAADYKILGDVQPDWTGGITNTITYKGLTLSALVDAKWGGSVYSMTHAWGTYAGVMAETIPGRWTGVVGKGVKDNGDGTFVANDVVVPAKNFYQSAFSNSVAEGSMFDATYVKLRQIQIGYKLPNSLLSGLPIRDVNFSIVGRNLAILYSKTPHVDPETGFSNSNGNQGLEFGQIPSTRSIGFNVSFKL